MEDDNWDLHAVVRGCCSAAPSNTNSSPIDLFPPPPPPLAALDLLPEPARTSGSFEDLHELCKPFFSKAEPSLFFKNAAAVSTGGKVYQPPQQKLFSRTSSQAPPRSKRKKNQFKKVCQVPAESLSSDIWAWRKYGQKPIKGSPYPRGYYRCSSSKGCLARKQVERNRSNPEIFIVTYTAEHNHPAPTHRNSLAGSTRHKPSTPPPAAAVPSPTTSFDEKEEIAPPAAMVPSPTTSFDEEEETAPPQSTGDSSMDDDEGDVALSGMAALNDDDFFGGLDFALLNGGGGEVDGNGDCFLDRFPANFGLSWNGSSTAAAATGS